MSDIAQLISQANAAAVANFQAAQLAKPFATYSLVQSEDLGAGVKYVLKSDGAGWLMIRKNYSDSGATLVYASSANNLMSRFSS